MLDSFARYQKGLKMHDLFPSIDGECSCGCGKQLSGKQKRWATSTCSETAYKYFAVLKGHTNVIRDLVFQRDEGFCRSCGAYDSNWQVDHIIEVRNGGGACGLINFQTLCPECHSEKTNTTTKEILNNRVICIDGIISLLNQNCDHHRAIS